MIVVGCMSTYREGRLARNALRSLLSVELDRLYVFEGPAGPIPGNADELDPTWTGVGDVTNVVFHEGRWRTDGRKRNAMLQRVKQDYPGELVWVVVVDADELLINGEYLRDRLDWIVANDRYRGASIATPDNPPMARWPLRLVEHEGSMSLITARVFRADLLRSIDHSTSVVTNIAGIRDGWGNYAENSRAWVERWLSAIDSGAMIAWPPMPAEPFLVHRSNLRHPARASLRMSVQEQAEFAAAQQAELDE